VFSEKVTRLCYIFLIGHVVDYSAIYPGDKIVSCHSYRKYEVTDVGILHPEEVSTSMLLPGQVGYVSCNMKDSSEGSNTSSSF
jgi:translation elongation factor EF-4